MPRRQDVDSRLTHAGVSLTVPPKRHLIPQADSSPENAGRAFGKRLQASGIETGMKRMVQGTEWQRRCQRTVQILDTQPWLQ